MYSIDQKHKQKISIKAIIWFIVIFLIICAVAAAAVWFFVLKSNDSSSANFVKEGSDKIVISGPKTKVIANDIFSITLPEAWGANGKQNPFSNQVYYEFQDKTPKQDNRYFKVYVDAYPETYPLKQVVPISAVGNKLDVGVISEGCQNFTKGAANSDVPTVWNGLKFTCSLNVLYTDIGSLNKNGGYGVKVVGASGQAHNYFFVYKDLNTHPQPENMTDILKSFIAK